LKTRTLRRLRIPALVALIVVVGIGVVTTAQAVVQHETIPFNLSFERNGQHFTEKGTVAWTHINGTSWQVGFNMTGTFNANVTIWF
jgi:hypothetical protein